MAPKPPKPEPVRPISVRTISGEVLTFTDTPARRQELLSPWKRPELTGWLVSDDRTTFVQWRHIESITFAAPVP